MGIVFSKFGKNNLKLYLNDIYKKECEISIYEEEVEFIRNGIEFCIHKIVDLLHEESFCLDHGPQQDLRSLKEVYFPIKMDTQLDKMLYGKIPFVKSSIVKVGSFYEGTKNKYPNEFDFIFYLYCLRKIPSQTPNYDFLNIFQIITEKYADILQHCHRLETDDKGLRKLKFVQVLRQHGPATELWFLYKSEFNEETIIHVDLVPAIKIVPCNLKKDVKEWVVLKPFHKHVCKTGSVMYTHTAETFSFTETEVYFIKNVLSANHVKTYRILKFIINGHGDDNNDYFYPVRGYHIDFPSYFIKVMMIKHHYECTNDTADIDLCILQVMKKIFNLQESPYLSDCGRHPGNFLTMLPLVRDAYNYFSLVQSSECIYEYEEFKIDKSISKYFIDLDLPEEGKIIWPGMCFNVYEKYETVFSPFHESALSNNTSQQEKLA